MAHFRGKDVVVKLGATTISGDGRSVSLEHSADTHDTSKYGSTARTKIAGLQDGSGSFEALDVTGAWTTAWTAILPGTSGTLTIWPEGAGSSFREVSCTIIVTARSLDLPYDDLATFSMSFEISGPITYGNQPV